MREQPLAPTHRGAGVFSYRSRLAEPLASRYVCNHMLICYIGGVNVSRIAC